MITRVKGNPLVIALPLEQVTFTQQGKVVSDYVPQDDADVRVRLHGSCSYAYVPSVTDNVLTFDATGLDVGSYDIEVIVQETGGVSLRSYRRSQVRIVNSEEELPDSDSTLDGVSLLSSAFFFAKGDKGEDGRGIVEIAKTGEDELDDIYTITYTDGTTSSFIVSNGGLTDSQFAEVRDEVVDKITQLYYENYPAFTVEFNDTDVLFDPDRFDITLAIIARLYGKDITSDIQDVDVAWSRYSEDADGNERTLSDAAWTARRSGSGKSIHLTRDDIDFNGYVPKVVRFTATVTLRDGRDGEEMQDSAMFEYQ